MLHGHNTVAYTHTTAFDRFVAATDEKRVLGQAIRERESTNRVRLLDVGAATGDLTTYYIGEFEHATLLEPVARQAAVLHHRFPGALVVQGEVDAIGSVVRFDTIVASHVFVYFTDPHGALLHLCNALAPSGRLIIVMLDSASDYCHFVDYFSADVHATAPTDIDSTQLAVRARKLGLMCEISHETSTIRTEHLEDFLEMNAFHFNVDPDGIPATVIRKMETYLARFVGSNDFRITESLKELER